MTAAQKAENERKCSLVLKYCETNYRRIGRGEDPKREDEEVQEFLCIRPIHIQSWLNQVAYHKEEPGVEDNPIL